ncbi:uncharacterized protein LY89DRAFT_602958 [Mollisia scopiformis]|uniref:Uncharacterized protein n=1 Tax=Mollisia scopiformis TaxID=149040 RepID=A0A132B2J9_MOLSC|nr:uncharacterized protein LY89DRAFT_602958 [Mollisia scopiformis]KUJ06620.1 hypothetical protein LY89DRAFT_602958 [Mollisia scopiformis]
MRKSAHVRFSYGQTDFPIFSSRLYNIQADIKRQLPNQISHLWRDKSDILRWYTFWAVVIVGGLGLFFALVQIVESAIQVEYAVKAYNPVRI